MLTWKRKLALSAGFLAALALFVAVMVFSPAPAAWMPKADAAVILKTVQTVSTTPITPTHNTITSTDGIAIANNGETIIWVTNNALAEVNVTITTPYEPISGLSLADLSFTLGAGQVRAVGPFEPTYFNATSGGNKGQTIIQASDTASVTVAALTW
jgi:hypothetical protein